MSLEKRIKGLLNVDSLKVNNISTGTSVNNLGVDASGNVVIGTTGGTDTNTFVTGGTLSGNNLILEKNNGVDVNPIDLSGLITGKTDLTLFNSHTGDTNNPHQTSFNNLTSTAHTHTISDVINLQTELDSKTNNTEFVSHTGDTTIHYTKSSINLSDLGSSAHTHTLSEITDFNSYSGSVQTQLNSKVGSTLFNSHTGDTNNPHQTSFSNLTSTAHTHTLSEITDFSSYSGSVQTQLDTKLNISEFNTYTGNTETLLNTKISGATNLSSEGIFAQKNGLDLEFKGITSTGGTVNISSNSTSVNLEVTTVGSDKFVSGGTYNGGTKEINFVGNSVDTTFDVDLTSLVSSVSANTFIISGTYIDSTDTLALLRNDGNFVTITGITDTFVTGQTFSNSTYILSTTRNDGTTFNTDLSVLATDVYVLSGVYNPATGIVTYTNSTGGTFQVSGFTTGMTDSYTTAANLNGETIEFDNNIQGSNLYNVSLSPVLSGKTDLTLFNSHTGDTNNPHQTSFSNLTSTAHTHTISDVTNLQSELDSKLNISDFNVYSGNVETQIDSKTDLTLFNSHTGDTSNPHQTSFSNLTSTAHTHTLSEITDFNSYSGDVQTQLDSKIENGINSGGANEVFSGKSGTDLYFRTISGGSNTTISTIDDIIRVDVTIPPDTNTFVTGGTYTTGTLTLDRNDGNSVLVTGFLTGNTLQEMLVNGNTSGGNDIIMTEGDDVVFNYGSFANYINTNPLTTNRNILFPDKDGTVALISDTTGHTENFYVTGGTFSSETLTLDRNDGGSVIVTGFTSTPSLNSGEIFVGNTGNTATSVPMSGDVNIDISGVTTIQTGVVTYSKMQTVSQPCLLGSTVSGGTITEIPSIDAYITTGSTAALLLDNSANWSQYGSYTGTTITGTYMGQSHYNDNYWYTAVQDNVWIRLIRG